LLLVLVLGPPLAAIAGTVVVGHSQIATLPVTLTVTGPVASASGQEDACGRPREPGELAILGRTTPAVDQGTVRIPELDLTSEIVAGCFEFRNLSLPQDPMLLSFEIRVDGHRPTTWAYWIVLGTGYAPNFTPRLEVGDQPQTFDLCAYILSITPSERSAAQNQQASLCAQLPNTGRLPEAGGGGAIADSGPLIVSVLIALIGAALICAGAVAHHRSKAS
jgi:hypothetical protein